MSTLGWMVSVRPLSNNPQTSSLTIATNSERDSRPSRRTSALATGHIADNKHVLDGIIERREMGVTVLSPASGRYVRRVLYVNAYGGAGLLAKIKDGSLAAHHLWGCFELVRKGYEVALAEPLPDFYLYRNPFPHDLRLLKLVRSWLGRDGIVYCGHNVLYWLPFLRAVGAAHCHVVSLLFAREPLNFGRAHSGIIALTVAAAEQARKLAPKAKVAHLGWGVDLDVFPKRSYQPDWFLSCGITQRDHRTLSLAAARGQNRIRVIAPKLPPELSWPAQVTLVTSGDGAPAMTYKELLADQYSRCAASLIILKNDPVQYTGVGMTNLLEAMAMSRPVIVTRTGALPTEIDVESAGCGLFVPPQDPDALAEAIQALADDPRRARLMGENGRRLCEAHYNIVRYADDLHAFFESL
jgi:hypothetical protein